MKFKIVATLLILASIPTGVMLGRFYAKAAPVHRPDFFHNEEIQAGPGEMVRKVTSGPQVNMVRARWVIPDLSSTKIEKMRTGHFSEGGRLEINPDPNRGREEIEISVLVEDPTTGNLLDTKEFGTVTLDPDQSLKRDILQKFDLPAGMYRITFLAALSNTVITHQDGSTSPAVVASHVQTIVVDL